MPDQYPASPIFNIEHLVPYQESPRSFGPRTVLPDTRTKLPSVEYAVEKIVGHRRKNGSWQYLLRWEGFDPQFNSWVTTRDLKNAPDLLHEYRKLHGL
jgi:hypothetical protein